MSGGSDDGGSGGAEGGGDDSEEEEEEEEEECPICLEDFPARALVPVPGCAQSAEHRFCAPCLLAALRSAVTAGRRPPCCPLAEECGLSVGWLFGCVCRKSTALQCIDAFRSECACARARSGLA